MRFLRWLGVGLLAIVVALLAAVGLARFGDGGVGPIAGGALTSGELVREPVTDWSFATDVDTIEFQLVEPPRSRTVWIAVHEASLYVPCGYLDVPLWKQWPHEAMRDGRSILRIEGERYPTQAVRIMDPDLVAKVGSLVAQKYRGGANAGGDLDSEATWIFRMDTRPAA